jgi:hypothetical protein
MTPDKVFHATALRAAREAQMWRTGDDPRRGNGRVHLLQMARERGNLGLMPCVPREVIVGALCHTLFEA